MFRNILLPTDGSDITSKAIEAALELAKATGARVHALSVKEPFLYATVSEMQPVAPQDFIDAQERLAERRLAAVKDACARAGVACAAASAEALHPWEAIVEHATRNRCDLVVMASRGRRGVAALLLGSETQKVLTHSQVPVLVVR